MNNCSTVNHVHVTVLFDSVTVQGKMPSWLLGGEILITMFWLHMCSRKHLLEGLPSPPTCFIVIHLIVSSLELIEGRAIVVWGNCDAKLLYLIIILKERSYLGNRRKPNMLLLGVKTHRLSFDQSI